MHSICVTKNDVHIDPDKITWDMNKEFDEFDNVYLDRDGKWYLRDIDDGYGRYPFQILTSFEDKFKYAMCEYLGYSYEDDPQWQEWYDEFKRIAIEAIPGFEDFRISTKEIDIYLDEDGNDIMQKDLHYDHYNEKEQRGEYYYLDADGNKHLATFDEENYLDMPAIGMIDHQSAGLLKNFLKDKGISLKEFLTNKKYIVVIDGDEIMDWDCYKKSGIINMDFIVEEYDKSADDVKYEQWKKEHGEDE